MDKIISPEPKVKIPDTAKLVFKGIIFDVYQWQQPMYDGSSKTFEELVRPDTVSIVPVTKDNKIIVLRQEQPGLAPYFCVPGGRVDPGEQTLFTSQRELLEETGYASTDWELLHAEQPLEKIQYVVFTLIARNCEPTREMHPDAGEKISLLFVSFEEFIELALTPDFLERELREIVYQAKLDPLKMSVLREQLLGKII